MKKLREFRFAFFILMLSSSAFAQIGVKEPPPAAKVQGPSLEETTQWLSQKLATSGARAPGKHENKYKLDFDGCTMTSLEEQEYRGNSGGSYQRTVKRIDLQRISLNSFSSSPDPYAVPGVTLSWGTTGRQEIIRMVYRNVDISSKNSLPSWESLIQRLESKPDGKLAADRFTLIDVEAAERIQNAMKHAIVLCQKKAAEEKAAEPPKPKEIF